MVVFITASPFIDGAERALLTPDNQLLDRLYAVLPENPRVLFVASNPDDHAGTCRFGADVFCAFAEAGICFSKYPPRHCFALFVVALFRKELLLVRNLLLLILQVIRFLHRL